MDGVDIASDWPLAQKFGSLGEIVTVFLPRILLLGSIIAFFLVVLAGVGVIASAGGGDPHATENRQKILTYAIVGLVIMFGSFWVLQLINFITKGALSGILGP